MKKTLMLGKIEGKRRREWQKMRLLESIADSMDMDWCKLWNIVKVREVWHAACSPWGSQKVRCDLATEEQQSASI